MPADRAGLQRHRFVQSKPMFILATGGKVDMLNRLKSVFMGFSRWCHAFGTLVVLPLMVLIITCNVAMRYFFNAPLAWGEEINGLLLFLALFLSMTYTWDQKKHIRMELVYVHLKGRWRALSDVLTALAGIVFFGLLAMQSIFDIGYMIKTNETGEELHIPLWPFRALAALISFVFVIKLIFYMVRGRLEEGEVVTEVEGVVIQRERE
nr:TRAP transporter small permease [uncultured Noviherbaspirillum sp.]